MTLAVASSAGIGAPFSTYGVIVFAKSTHFVPEVVFNVFHGVDTKEQDEQGQSEIPDLCKLVLISSSFIVFIGVSPRTFTHSDIVSRKYWFL